MAGLTPAGSRVCLSCCRRIFALGSPSARTIQPSLVQTRGQKKSTRLQSKTMAVRLLQDITGYGKKGSIVPVLPGLFRNSWFPAGKAEYLDSFEEARLAKKTVVRDFEFGKDIEALRRGGRGIKAERPLDNTAPRVKLLDGRRAMEILQERLPTSLFVSRAVIETSSTDDAARAIYGSVSAQDVADLIKETLAGSGDGEAFNLTITADDVLFVPREEEGSVSAAIEGSGASARVKSLGVFDVEIQLKGSEEGVRRRISVLALDEAAAKQQSSDKVATQPLSTIEPPADQGPAEYIDRNLTQTMTPALEAAREGRPMSADDILR